ncbi:MAG: hypothetical protein GWN01_10430, partial [Nitrosopumilaceae archaeon]|nr:hypothetical protein [Nitrosopumilaceae archaeon]NIU87654.1 hypothetical protein [Nitrosopumilaceae archaeon]NIV66075.1 hypothetical protein [Nitrosopumilaceae archaeon]NIX61916.1 hypothetical protein [Nitrosopumilaceae archaeon]
MDGTEFLEMMKHFLPDWPPPTPKEHGAWGILFGSFFSVIGITHIFLLSQLLLVVSISLFYFSRQPFLSIIKSRSRKNKKWVSSQTRWFLIFSGLGWLFLFASVYLSQYYLIISWSL